MPSPPQRTPSHVRHAKLAKRVQLLLVVASAGFALYRLVAIFRGESPLH